MTGLTPARSLGLDALAGLFNACFADYLLPMQLDPAALADHIERNDVSLGDSPVAVDGEPAAFALLAVRGADAWIGGMGTLPSHRRGGLGARVMQAAVETASARGCEAVWLEVIDRNEPARRLYERLGFEHVRDLGVWSLEPGSAASGGLDVDVGEAAGWIAAHRDVREPWQRGDATLRRMRAAGVALRGLAVDRVGAAVYTANPGSVTVQQAAAVDDAAAEALLAACAAKGGLRFTNVAYEGRLGRALERLGAQAVVRQHELRLRLG
jgi:GNAT superfamily N-acetyltransferase